MGLDAVDQLGTRIEQEWQAADFEPRQFSDVAVSSLREARLSERLTPGDIVEWALNTSVLPPQVNLPAKFGQPPVTLFRSRRFYVEALFWLDGTTSIHQHAFSGAFQVLAGSSIETRYGFEKERSFDGHFVIGDLRVVETSFLRRGDVRPIRSGVEGVIHSLFHLDRPSVTLVVRTFQDPGAGPQFTYAHPGIGYDPFFKDESRERALELVAMLRQLGSADLEEKIGGLLSRSDSHAAFRILGECVGISDRRLFDRLVRRVHDQELAERFNAAFEEVRRITFLRGRRKVVTDPELRFFLGVLLNARHRQDVLRLAQARMPGTDPARTVAAWVRQLSSVNVSLQAAGLPWQPNMFALPEMNDALELVLLDSLAGRDPVLDETGDRFLSTLRAVPALKALFG